jgi:hypothetical protein
MAEYDRLSYAASISDAVYILKACQIGRMDVPA